MAHEKTFRSALAEDMQRLGLSEAAIGRRMDISQQAVHKWVERGFPPLARLEELLRVLGPNSEVGKIPREVLYATRGRTVLSTRSMPLGYASGAVLAQETHRLHREVVKAQLPPHLHKYMQLPIPDGGNSDLRVDFANEKVVIEGVTIVGANASRNVSSALLQLMLYREKVPTIDRAVLMVICEDVTRPLPKLVEEAAASFKVEVLHVRDGDEAARRIAEMLGVRVNVELYEPEE